MTRGYAAGTTVPIERTAAQIEKLLADYGASQFVRGWSGDRVALGFTIGTRQVRIDLPMPDRDEFRLTPTGKRRSDNAQDAEFAQEQRRRWRSLHAVIKAKLVAVEDGISTIEREFLADIVLPDGSTLGAWAGPQIAAAYESAAMPALLPGAVA